MKLTIIKDGVSIRLETVSDGECCYLDNELITLSDYQVLKRYFESATKIGASVTLKEAWRQVDR